MARVGLARLACAPEAGRGLLGGAETAIYPAPPAETGGVTSVRPEVVEGDFGGVVVGGAVVGGAEAAAVVGGPAFGPPWEAVVVAVEA